MQNSSFRDNFPVTSPIYRKSFYIYIILYIYVYHYPQCTAGQICPCFNAELLGRARGEALAFARVSGWHTDLSRCLRPWCRGYKQWPSDGNILIMSMAILRHLNSRCLPYPIFEGPEIQVDNAINAISWDIMGISSWQLWKNVRFDQAEWLATEMYIQVHKEQSLDIYPNYDFGQLLLATPKTVILIIGCCGASIIMPNHDSFNPR